MKKVNNKGFSLLEVLAVIIILSALSMVIVPNIMTYIEKSKDEYIYNLKNSIILTTKDFYANNRNRLLTKTDGTTKDYVTIDELKSLNYITGEIKDSKGNDCTTTTYVVAINEGLGYKYYTCLICGEKVYFNTEEEKYCDLN